MGYVVTFEAAIWTFFCGTCIIIIAKENRSTYLREHSSRSRIDLDYLGHYKKLWLIDWLIESLPLSYMRHCY